MRSDVYEIGISDHHKMFISVLRKIFAKDKQKRCLLSLLNVFYSFNETLKNRISLPNLSFENCFEIFQSSLDFFVRYSQNSFMTKRKEIMIRSKLRNKFNKSHSSLNLEDYKMQRNKCTKVLRNAK